MTAATLHEAEPKAAAEWINAGRAVLIDVREPDEYAREHIAGARLVPLSGFDKADFGGATDKIAIFHCASGNRTAVNAERILSTGFREVYHLKGGLAGWKAAGLPTRFFRKAPISMMRQVQIVAGGLVLLSLVLAITVSPWFAALAACVGAGQVFAGLSGTCAMARLLGYLPYNRRSSATA